MKINVDGKTRSATQFLALLKLVGVADATEDCPIKLGNAEFWTECEEIIHNPAMSNWDTDAISADLVALMEDRAKSAKI